MILHTDEDPLRAARGVITGVAISAAIWILVIAMWAAA